VVFVEVLGTCTITVLWKPFTVNDSVVEPGVDGPQPDVVVAGDAALAVEDRLATERHNAAISSPTSTMELVRRSPSADHVLESSPITALPFPSLKTIRVTT
jgi:hypothetical protein